MALSFLVALILMMDPPLVEASISLRHCALSDEYCSSLMAEAEQAETDMSIYSMLSARQGMELPSTLLSRSLSAASYHVKL